MTTFTEQVNLYTDLSRNTSAKNIDLGKRLINIKQREILMRYPRKFLHDTYQLNLVAGTSTYRLKTDVNKVNSIHIPDNSTTLELISRRELSELQSSSGRPYAYYIEGNNVTFYPAPDTTYTAEISYTKRIPEFTFDDVSAGTIDVTNGSAIVTGTGTSFTANMVGKHILLPDGLWYEIVSVTGANLLNIAETYPGQTETGASYRIGQLSPLVDGTEMIPVYLALADYFKSQEGGAGTALSYETKAEKLISHLNSFTGSASDSVVIWQ